MLSQFAKRNPSVTLELRTAKQRGVSDLVARARGHTVAPLLSRLGSGARDRSRSPRKALVARLLAGSPPRGRPDVRDPGGLAEARGRWVGLPPQRGGASHSPRRSASSARRGRHRGRGDRPHRQPHRARAAGRGGVREDRVLIERPKGAGGAAPGVRRDQSTRRRCGRQCPVPRADAAMGTCAAAARALV